MSPVSRDRDSASARSCPRRDFGHASVGRDSHEIPVCDRHDHGWSPRMNATVTRGVADGFEALVLENSRIRASVIPSLGGRVWELLDRARGRQWIWHREDVPLAASAAGASYDDVWAGGWEELFPNDAPG